MVPLVDVGLAALIAALCPAGTPVVWAPVASARRRLAATDDPPDGSIRLPGVSVYRVGTEPDLQQASVPEGHRGYPLRYRDDVHTGVPHALLTVQRRRNVIARYEVGLFGTTLSQVNDLERPLSFLGIYRPVVVVEGGLSYRFLPEPDAPLLDVQVNDRSSFVQYVSSVLPVSVRTFWVLSAEVRTVYRQIYNIYEQMQSGDDISHLLLTSLELLPKEE